MYRQSFLVQSSASGSPAGALRVSARAEGVMSESCLSLRVSGGRPELRRVATLKCYNRKQCVFLNRIVAKQRGACQSHAPPQSTGILVNITHNTVPVTIDARRWTR